MATFLKVSSANNSITLDPVQGLVDYVLDIKPYHTKIFEVLIQYIHTDPINVTFKENYQLIIDFETINVQPAYKCGYGIVYDPLIVSMPYPITAINGANNYFTIAGNHAVEFVYGYPFTINGTSLNDGTYHVLVAVYNGASTLIYTLEDVASGGMVGTGILEAQQIGYTDPPICGLSQDSGLYAGFVISERLEIDLGINLIDSMQMFDTVAVNQIIENQDPGAYDDLPFGALYSSIPFGAAVVSGGELIGSFDYQMFDVGGFDEDLTTLNIIND